jgi:hypothetical protein
MVSRVGGSQLDGSLSAVIGHYSLAGMVIPPSAFRSAGRGLSVDGTLFDIRMKANTAA